MLNFSSHMDLYEQLALTLDTLPAGYPRTESGVELKILQKIFSLKEIEIAAFMTKDLESVETIAERAQLPVKKVERKLKEMMFKGIIWGPLQYHQEMYRLAPVAVGFWEEQWETIDEELATLWLQYMEEGASNIFMGATPLERVVPAQTAIDKEHILPYDELISLIEKANHFELRDCICRKNKRLTGHQNCNYPLDVCLTFLKSNMPNGPHTITKEKALEIIKKSEEIGLVHTVGNYARGIFYCCNCCGCCCDILRGLTVYGSKEAIAKANYTPIVDETLCTGCGTCETRCQVKAITVAGTPSIDYDKCIGCGLCASGCPSAAIQLQVKPEAELIQPPERYTDWEIARLRAREILADHDDDETEFPGHHHH
jgi:ferredoxin